MRFIIIIFLCCSCQSVLSTLPQINSCPKKTLPSEKKDWFYTKNKSRGLVLLAHGLNLNPEKMNSLSLFYNSIGLDVYRPILDGHQGSIESMKKLELGRWIVNSHQHYCQAKSYAQHHSLPLYFSGYSLGALIHLYLQEEFDHVHYDKQILLAPAINLPWYANLIKVLYLFGDQFLVPTLNIKDYQAQKGTSIAGYKMLFNTVKKLQHIGLKKSNIPSLIFMSKNDELVSYHGIERMIKKYHLGQWKMVPINNRQSKLKGKFSHLVIDPLSLGENQWSFMIEKIQRFLK